MRQLGQIWTWRHDPIGGDVGWCIWWGRADACGCILQRSERVDQPARGVGRRVPKRPGQRESHLDPDAQRKHNLEEEANWEAVRARMAAAPEIDDELRASAIGATR